MKPRIIVKKLKGAYGETTLQKGKRAIVKINVKKHKGDKKELANTIKHELMHVKHPNMSEKEVYKKTGKAMSQQEQDKLIAKLRGKKIHYKEGALKRKFGVDKKYKTQPGDYITKMNAQKAASPRSKVAIMGMV